VPFGRLRNALSFSVNTVVMLGIRARFYRVLKNFVLYQGTTLQAA
jgi:hypothetical protein